MKRIQIGRTSFAWGACMTLLLVPGLLSAAPAPSAGAIGAASPALVAASAPLAAPVATDLESGAPLFGTPAPTFMSCSISRACGDGNTAACTGNSSCVNSLRGVSCDGVETACPNFCTISLNCPRGVLTCASLAGACTTTPNGIACNGHEHVCKQ